MLASKKHHSGGGMGKTQARSKIIQLVHSITESDIHRFRNTSFDNMAVKLLTSGHRQSFEFLQQIVEQNADSKLVEDEETLLTLRDYFTQAEDFCRDGRFNQVSQAYCEAASNPAISSMHWLQELIMQKALAAAEKFKADGGRQQAYCQLQLAGMLEATKVRKLREDNIIYGTDYRVKPPKRCVELLERCLEASLGRSQWLSDLVQFEYLCAGHLARLLLAENTGCEANLKRVIKLAEQAGCAWLESLGNFYLGKLLAENGERDSEAAVRLERGLEVVHNNSRSSLLWSNSETCIQAPSDDRLAGMCTCELAKIKLHENTEKSAEQAKLLLENFMEKFQETSDERADCYILLGELEDRYFNSPEKAVELYSQAYKSRPNVNSNRVAMGVANGHLMLDSVMALVCNKDKTHNNNNANTEQQDQERVSKRLLIWKDQPDDFEHDLESD